MKPMIFFQMFPIMVRLTSIALKAYPGLCYNWLHNIKKSIALTLPLHNRNHALCMQGYSLKLIRFLEQAKPTKTGKTSPDFIKQYLNNQ